MQPAPARPPPKPTVPSKMTLASVRRGRIDRPVRIVLYGEAGIGKSTFGSEAPDPVFVGAEDGTSHLDVARFPAPETWEDVKEANRVLATEAHGYKTVIYDTLDWLEPLLWAYICKRDNQQSIESYGFGKGYIAAVDEWRVFLAGVERIYQRGINVVMLAHSHVKTFKNPEGPDYDRWQMKIDPKAASLVREWSDATLFARFETYANKEKKESRAKGISTDKRLIHTVQTAAYDAKNRYSLPETMPLDWQTFAEAAKAHAPADAGELIAAIKRNLPSLTEQQQQTVQQKLTEAGTNAERLAKINAWVNAKMPAPEAAPQAQE